MFCPRGPLLLLGSGGRKPRIFRDEHLGLCQLELQARLRFPGTRGPAAGARVTSRPGSAVSNLVAEIILGCDQCESSNICKQQLLIPAGELP